jgi:hypothetical protein
MPAYPQARFGEAGVERNVAAQLWHVVIRPRDRVDAERDGHRANSQDAERLELAAQSSGD